MFKFPAQFFLCLSILHKLFLVVNLFFRKFQCVGTSVFAVRTKTPIFLRKHVIY